VGGGRRRGAARRVGDCLAGAGEREGERKVVRKLPHHHVVLRGRSIDGGRQRSGVAAADRARAARRRRLGFGARAAVAWGKEARGCGSLSRGS
jgi:hypothetical protein